MVGIILASHGELAQGILQSSKMIIGETENIAALSIMPSESPDQLRSKMEEVIKSFSTDQVVFLVDIYSGSPFNQANLLLQGNEDKRAIVTGLNLPMLLEAIGNQDEDLLTNLLKC